MMAQDESRRLCHNYVGPEQVLLGLLQVETGIAYSVLTESEIDLQKARIEVEKKIGKGTENVEQEIPFSPECKHLLVMSAETMKKMGSPALETGHLLLGICADNNPASEILTDLGVDVHALYEITYHKGLEQYKTSESIIRSCKDSLQELTPEDEAWLPTMYRLARTYLSFFSLCGE